MIKRENNLLRKFEPSWHIKNNLTFILEEQNLLQDHKWELCNIVMQEKLTYMVQE